MFGQAYDHSIKTGIKDKLANILRAGMALMDTDSDNYVSSAELRTYATKVLPIHVVSSSCTYPLCVPFISQQIAHLVKFCNHANV